MLERLRDLDRRILFLIVGLSVVFPLLRPFGDPPEVTEPTRAIYNFVEALKPGDTILMGFDYGSSTFVECDPMAIAMLRQCYRKGINVLAVAMLADGVPFMRRDLQDAAAEFHKKNGTDYVDLGYQLGGVFVMKSMGQGFAYAFPADIDGVRTDSWPLMQKVKNFRDVAAVMSFSSSDPGIKQWIQVVTAEYKRPVGGGCTAVSVAEFATYMNSGQLVGLLGGLRGAAEYEVLVDRPGTGIKSMAGLSVAHILIVLLIIFSNILFFLERFKGRGRG